MLKLGNIFIFCYIAILSSCNSTGSDNRTNFAEENSLFSPPLLITIDELKSRGYRKIDSLGEINKTVGDALISYSFINDKKPIYLRQVVKLSIDSAAVKTWINHNGGQVISHAGNKLKLLIATSFSSEIIVLLLSNQLLIRLKI